jgi:hypothetical protein
MAAPRGPLKRKQAESNKVKIACRNGFLMLTGSIVAIATPLQRGGALDLPALRLIDFHFERALPASSVVHHRRIADRRFRRAL